MSAESRETTAMSSKEESVEIEGTVLEQLPNAVLRVELDDGNRVLTHTSGEVRKLSLRIMPGDRVVVALSPYDLTRGRIVRRCK
jgi:translation initiation factor IF-1